MMIIRIRISTTEIKMLISLELSTRSEKCAVQKINLLNKKKEQLFHIIIKYFLKKLSGQHPCFHQRHNPALPGVGCSQFNKVFIQFF